MSSRLFLLLAALIPLAAAHGYLCTPPPRGIEHESSQIDLLKSPNTRGVCRGETKPGKIQKVTPGGSLTLGFTITAPHTGPCEVYLLDLNLKNSKKIASKYDCAAPGKVGPWTIKLPSGVSGRKVLRWYWEGRHISTPGEPYEQCIDLDFGGSSYGGNDNDSDNAGQENDEPEYRPKPTKNKPSYSSQDDDEEQGDEADYGSGNDGSEYGSQNSRDASNDYGSEEPSEEEEEEKPRHRKPSKHDSYKPTKPSKHTRKQNSSESDNSNDGGCEHGKMECCPSGGYRQCANGKWYNMKCPVGLRCKNTSNSIICDWPQSSSKY